MTESVHRIAASEVPVVHEDARVLVVHKPAGIPVIPGRFDPFCLAGLLGEARGEKPWIVHRIDQETSGLVVFARDAAAHRSLSMAFENRLVRKRYLALLDGAPSPAAGEVRKPLRQFGSGRMGVDPARGKPSLTAYRTLGRHEGLALVEAEPKTGRRHQLRVHFHSLGTPVAGDPLYGEKERQKRFPRMFLHACGLHLPHPDGGELRLEIGLPGDFPAGLPVPAWEP